MKKTILISCSILAILSLTAFAYINKNDSSNDKLEIASNEIPSKAEDAKKETFPDFIYGIGSRFGPIKKEDINNIKSINDFFNEEDIEKMGSIKSIEIIIVENEKRTNKKLVANSNEFTNDQIEFLKSFDYSTSFLIDTNYEQKNIETGKLEYSAFTPHHTIVPEIQAEYIYGKEALINFFKENTKAETANVSAKKLKPAKLYFTVTEKGTIDNVHLDRSSGYPDIDNLMTNLISETPGGWIPATNSEGENIKQELTVSFGLMGC